jgi:hypothetical protein
LWTIEVKDGSPLTLPFLPPNDFALQEVSDGIRFQIPMEIEETRVEGLIACPQIQPLAWGVVFG